MSVSIIATKGDNMTYIPKPLMILKETETTYQASVKNLTATLPKDANIIVNGIKQHPRMLVIEQVASYAGITDWDLLEVK